LTIFGNSYLCCYENGKMKPDRRKVEHGF